MRKAGALVFAEAPTPHFFFTMRFLDSSKDLDQKRGCEVLDGFGDRPLAWSVGDVRPRPSDRARITGGPQQSGS
jgi:hypothetical protein